MGKIVVAVDGSEHSERALEFYFENFHKDGNELVFVHSLEYPYIPGKQYVPREACEKKFESAKEDGRKIVHKFEERCRAKNIPFQTLIEFACPGEYVCKVAQDVGATAILMGTRGMGTIRRTIFGSVSDYVVHHAHCPVMIARH